MRNSRKPITVETANTSPIKFDVAEIPVELGNTSWKREAITLKTPSRVNTAPIPPNVRSDSIVNFSALVNRHYAAVKG